MLKKIPTLKPYCHFFLCQEKETGGEQRPRPAPTTRESTAQEVPGGFKGSFETPRDTSFQGFLFFGSLRHSAYHVSQVKQGRPLPKTGHGGKILATAFSLWLRLTTCHLGVFLEHQLVQKVILFLFFFFFYD